MVRIDFSLKIDTSMTTSQNLTVKIVEEENSIGLKCMECNKEFYIFPQQVIKVKRFVLKQNSEVRNEE